MISGRVEPSARVSVIGLQRTTDAESLAYTRLGGVLPRTFSYTGAEA